MDLLSNVKYENGPNVYCKNGIRTLILGETGGASELQMARLSGSVLGTSHQEADRDGSSTRRAVVAVMFWRDFGRSRASLNRHRYALKGTGNMAQRLMVFLRNGYLYLVFGALFLSLTAGFARAESAAEIQDKMKFCEQAAALALVATSARDAGVPLDQAQQMVSDTVPEGVQRQFVSGVLRLVYVMEGVEGPIMEQVARQMCEKQSGLKQ